MKSLMTLCVTFIVFAALVWPVFVVVSLLFSYLAGEGSVINTWYLEPKRNLLAHFIEGYKNSVPVAVALAAIPVLCAAAPRKLKILRLAVLIVLPLAGFAIANYFYASPQSVQLAFISSGMALAAISLTLSGLALRVKR